MPYSREQASEDIRRELKELAEDIRRERNTPAWHALFPLCLGVVFGVAMMILASFVARLL